MDGYKHYIRLNEDNFIILRFSSAFPETAIPQVGDICVNEDGDRHYNEPVTNGRGQYIAKWVNGAEVARTEQEVDAEWNARPPEPPSLEERLRAIEDAQLASMGL